MSPKMYWFSVRCDCGTTFPFGTPLAKEAKEIAKLSCVKCGKRTTTARPTKAPVEYRERPSRAKVAPKVVSKGEREHKPCNCAICRTLSKADVEAVDLLAAVFKHRTLAFARCKERGTDEQVIVLGAVTDGGFVPLARLFKDKPMLEVAPPEGFLDPLRLQHRGQA